MKPRHGLILAAITAALAANARPVPVAVSFLGVASGDATYNSGPGTCDVTLWSRATLSGGSATVFAEVATDIGFSGIVYTSAGLVTTSVTPTAASPTTGQDFTSKQTVAGLAPGTVYYYRFRDSGATSVSGIGKFKTPPLPTAAYPLHFAFSGDCDGLIRPYVLASQVPSKNLDFFMFDGDTEYETSASIGSAAVTSTGNIPDPATVTKSATSTQLFTDFSRKYREQFGTVNAGGQTGLKDFFAGQANYTAYDNHELGNKQYINGGAPAGGGVGSATGNAPYDLPSGAGVDARVPANDVNTSGAWMNKTPGFQIMQQVFLGYQPIKDRGTVVAPGDGNANGTKQLYFAQQWGKNAIFVNTDCRSYRDIRVKTAGNADDIGARADNASRTMLGVTQLAWLESALLAAEQAGTTWKFVNISDPIDEIAPVAGSLSMQNGPTVADYGTIGNVTSATASAATANSTLLAVATGATQNGYGLVAGQPISGAGIPPNTKINSVNVDGSVTLNNAVNVALGAALTLSGAPSAYAPVNADGGKSFVGGYRAERNALLKFIADNHINNVVFLATDDHQNRVNEVVYSPSGRTGPGSPGFAQSDYVKVPYCFSIVCGPLGATGPDLISNHSFALAQKLAQSIANAEIAAGVEPIGLGGYPGLHNVTRDGNPNADTTRAPEDFYSPDTFNYNILDLGADGLTLTVTSKGINSTAQNAFTEYDGVNNPERTLFSFQVAAGPVAAPDTLMRANNVTVAKVAKSVLLGNDAVTTGTPSILSVGNALPAGATVALAGNFVIYTSPTATAGNGSYTYTLGDGTGTATGFVTVLEVPPGANTSGPNAVRIVASGPDFVVTFIGVPGNAYRVQFTTSTSAPYVWQDFDPIISNPDHTAPANGVFSHTDPSPVGPIRLYRAIPKPSTPPQSNDN